MHIHIHAKLHTLMMHLSFGKSSVVTETWKNAKQTPAVV